MTLLAVLSFVSATPRGLRVKIYKNYLRDGLAQTHG